jgi:hypothetical protein
MNDLLIIYSQPARDLTVKLKEISRSAFPVAIRTALNSAAYDVKKNTLQKSADKHFVKRSSNFFKANSRVIQAQGFDINSMEAAVGMNETGLKGAHNYAVKDLQKQEFGGTIVSKSFIPINTARAGKSLGKNVLASNRLNGINKIVDARHAKGKNDKEKFVKSVFFAGVGGYVLARFRSKMILWRVNSLSKIGDKFKLTALYSFKQHRAVSVHPTGFMHEAGNISRKKIEDFYIIEAKKQLAKVGILV